MRATPEPDFAAYVQARQQTLLRAAYLVCGDRQLAEDLLQDALVKLAARWRTVREEHPDAFVRRILYRDAVSSWRKRRREVLTEPIPYAVPAPDPAPGVGDRLDLWRALDTLTPRQRAVLVLRFFDDRSVAETADALGVSEGTVKSTTHDALARMRAALPDIRTPEELSTDGGAR